LLPALEVWAAAVSRPEPDLLIVNAGRRDMSFDAGMPVAVKRTEVGAPAIEHLDEWWPVERIMDQHAMLRIPTSVDLGPGDLIGLGISHPCTTFDKWSLLPVVDDGYHVVDAVVTAF
jgi:D-serine dehydratase